MSVRALNPVAAGDIALLQAVNRGAFIIHGFRNRDIRQQLFGDAAANDAAERKRQAARVTRLLRLLRGHGRIVKLGKTHRYQLTEQGRASISAVLTARQADAKQLLQAA